nr:MAG TPA: hypothetical protein [Caudoviricetes sp.]
MFCLVGSVSCFLVPYGYIITRNAYNVNTFLKLFKKIKKLPT